LVISTTGWLTYRQKLPIFTFSTKIWDSRFLWNADIHILDYTSVITLKTQYTRENFKHEILTSIRTEAVAHKAVTQNTGHGYMFRLQYTWRFIMFSVITNIYNKKTKGPTLTEFFTATRKLKTRTSLVVKKKPFSVFLWL